MTPLHIPTPLISHAPLSATQGRDVLLKMESLQPSGSFKLRGLGLMCQRAVASGATHLVCPSGGNAGFAAAVSGVALGVRTMRSSARSAEVACCAVSCRACTATACTRCR
ncbi:pyridoxal-phosphate dependent enzyme [Archangium sp.]|uniref:pyridoxal-phosphate dependent enzyme n=1 Tax=Archangium sp. TaxID=1872627 RepID=UPI0038D456C0